MMHPPHVMPTKAYGLVYVALLVLLGATVGVAFLSLGPLNLLITLLIAAAKTGLVMVYFMHLRGSPRLIQLSAGAGFLWLLLMMALALSDYLTRGWESSSWEQRTSNVER